MEEQIRILCVDDEPNVLTSLRRLFIDEAYTILTAASANEGLELLTAEKAQIIISDYRMPNMNGVEFLSEVCTRWPNTVRIVLSGYADTASIVSAINEGQIYKFIPKPWNDDELKVAVACAIERYYLFKKNAELTSELVKVNEDLKGLLAEYSKLLDLKGKMLEANQTIIFSLPVPVLGISDDIVVQCNEAWATEIGDRWSTLGKTVDETLSSEVVKFIQDVKSDKKTRKDITINNIRGCLFGSIVRGVEHEDRGIILIFVRGECS